MPLVAAGAMIATGVLVKQQALFSALPVLFWAFAELKEERWAGSRRLAWVASGAAVPVVAILIYFALNGELRNFLFLISPEGAVTDATGGQVSGELIWRIAREETMKIVNAMPLLYYAGTVFLLIMIWNLLRRQRISRIHGFLLIWLLGGQWCNRRHAIYEHYYIQLIPIFCLSVGLLMHHLSTNQQFHP